MLRRNRVIKAWDLTKNFGKIVALDGLYFDIVEGECFAFLGISGSGRSTLMQLLMGLQRPSQGSSEALGYDCWSDSYQIRKLTGFVFNDFQLYQNLSGRNYLDICSSARGGYEAKRKELVEQLKLDENLKIRFYSQSEKIRLLWVQALMHDPPLLLLDDPFKGLDSSSKTVLQDLLRSESATGKTIVLSTDTVGDVPKVADRVGLLFNGELKGVHDVNEMGRIAGRQVKIIFREEIALEDFITHNMSVISHTGKEWVVTLRGEAGSFLKRLGKHSVEDVAFIDDVLENALMDMFGDCHSGYKL